jgi:hypothetical protein
MMVKHIIDYKTLMEAPSLRKFHYYEHSAVLFLNGVENVVVCSNLLFYFISTGHCLVEISNCCLVEISN